MSGVRDSEKRSVKKEKSKTIITPEEVKKKFGHEPMNISEFRLLIETLKKENGDEYYTITEKTLKNYLNVIANKSNGLININDFKEETENPKSPFSIKPELQGYLLILICSNYFEGRSNDRILATRYERNASIAANIQRFLSTDDFEMIKNHPSLLNAKLEAVLSKKINDKLIVLLRELYHTNPLIRYKYMRKVLMSLKDLREEVAYENSKEFSFKMIYSYMFDNLKDKDYQKAMFEAENLDELILGMLALRLKEHEYSFTYEDSLPTPTLVGLYHMMKRFNFVITKKNDTEKDIEDVDKETEKDIEDVDKKVEKYIEAVDKEVEKEYRYKEISEKIKEILNLDNLSELYLYTKFMDFCKAIYCMPYISSEDYNNMVRFTESAIAKDKWDVLREVTSDDFKIGRRKKSITK